MRTRGRTGAARARRPRGVEPPAPRLTLLLEEGAAELHTTPRHLRMLLKREQARCLVRIGRRYLLDRQGFYEWCRRQGIRT